MTSRELLHPKALPPFAALRAFEAVGRLGGIRKAADSLSLDHAVISRHIRLLEEWLGVQLFSRSSGRLQLTEAGAGYHGRVSAVLVELASATADLVQHEADVDIRFYGDSWLPQPGGRGLKYVELARPPVLAVTSPAMAARLGSGLDVKQLLEAPLLHEESDEQWRAWFCSNGVEFPSRIPGPLLWHAHLAIAAARAGRGIALASTYLIDRDLRSGDLVELDFRSPARPVIGAYVFVAREDRWSLPVVAELRHFLQAHTH
jgi:DNA-binding transcriptional LysR family regulator